MPRRRIRSGTVISSMRTVLGKKSELGLKKSVAPAFVFTSKESKGVQRTLPISLKIALDVGSSNFISVIRSIFGKQTQQLFWLQRTADAELEDINSKLLVAKRVFPQFWRLQEDVRNFFLDNADSAQRRGNLRTLLQTIELLCNARDVVQELTLDEIETLSRLLEDRTSLPAFIRPQVAKYFDNKGTRSWETDDRRVVPIAWRKAAART